MKTISLGLLAILLAGATTFAANPAMKTDTVKTKHECAGQCPKNTKTNSCKDKKFCLNMDSCRDRCS